jgi:hypothetical protein
MNDLFRVTLTFPDNPVIDDEYLAQNNVTYRWDGEAWVALSGPGGGAGTPPIDDYVLKAGDTMIGPLILSGDPTIDLESTTKRYVDLTVADSLDILKDYLPLSGGIMSGNITISNTTPVFILNNTVAGGSFIFQDRANNILSIHHLSSDNIPISTERLLIDQINNTTTINGVTQGTGILPTQPNHFTNKAYVDQIVTGSRLIIGAIDADTGICTYTIASGLPNGPLVDASTAQSGHYVMCSNPGTIPGGPANGITMQILDMLISDGNQWIYFHTPSPTITLASQVALVPNVAGGDNVQVGMQNIDTNYKAADALRVLKAGDTMSGRLRFWTNPVSPPSESEQSAGNRLELYPTTGDGFSIGVESNNMWFNTGANNNGFKFYMRGYLRFDLQSTVTTLWAQTLKFSSPTAVVGYSQIDIGTAATNPGFMGFYTSEGTRRGYIGSKSVNGNYLVLNGENGWNWEIPQQPRLSNGYVAYNPCINIGTANHILRAASGVANTPELRFEDYNAALMGLILSNRTGFNTSPEAELHCGTSNGGWGWKEAWRVLVGSPPQFYAYGNVSCESLTQRCLAANKHDIRLATQYEHKAAFDTLNVKRFKLNTEVPFEAERERWGFVAEELPEDVVAYAAPGSSDLEKMKIREPEGIDLMQALAITVAQVKELQAEIAQLKSKLS